MSLTLPQRLFNRSGKVLLTIETPDAASPKQLGTGADERRLGLAFRTLKLTAGGAPKAK